MSMVDELTCPDMRVVGSKQVLRYAGMSMLRKVFIAKDADEEVTNRLIAACENNRIPYDMSYTMHQIGNACHIEVGSACAAVRRKMA